MDLSDLPDVPGKGPAAPAFAADRTGDRGFRELVGQLGLEVATPMTSAHQQKLLPTR